MWKDYFKKAHFIKGFYKFIFICIILFLYFLYLIYKYGLKDGIGVTLLTWAFFVFGTDMLYLDFI